MAISVTVDEGDPTNITVTVTEGDSTTVAVTETGNTTVNISVTENSGPPGPAGPVGPQGPSGNITRELLSGTPDDVETNFLASQSITEDSETVYINGLAQRPGVDYTINDMTVSFTEPLEVGDTAMITYSPIGG